MDPELLNALMLGGGLPVPMVPPPGMMGGMIPPQGFGDMAALPPGSPPGMPPRPVEPYMTDPLATGGQPTPQAPGIVPIPMSRPTSLGAALEPAASTGVPLPTPRPTGAPGSASLANPKFTDALKGVVAPPAPVAQKVSTPHPPPLAKIQGGGVAELLASLGIGPQQAFPGLKLPSTLGQALGG